ncbi:unnamed protein product, partial [Trichogramma brassicae]
MRARHPKSKCHAITTRHLHESGSLSVLRYRCDNDHHDSRDVARPRTRAHISSTQNLIPSVV